MIREKRQTGNDTELELGRELEEELKELRLEVRKLQRALKKERYFNERTRANLEAKRQLSDIVLTERSRLERNMSLMLRHSANMFLFFDTDGIIEFCADLFLNFRGLAGFGLIKGKNIRQITQDFLPEDFIQTTEALLGPASEESMLAHCSNQQEANSSCSVETKFQSYSNIEKEERCYTARAVLLINDTGEKDGLLVQLYDTTEYIQAQRSAEQANMAKSDFLATVSHEIRTPMNAILGLTDMLFTTEIGEQQREYLSKIRASSIAMLGLINDILDFSKIEAEKLDLIHEYFDLVIMLENLESMFEVMMEQKGLRFEVDFDPSLPQVVLSDDKRVRQVLTNVLNNAYKYTPQGRVLFAARPVGNDIVRFDISDTGIGIKDEDIESLFKEFEQLDVVRNKHVTGTGLGLAITKRLVEMMDGRIEVSSVYGEGSTFSVYLPFKEGNTSDLPASQTEELKFVAPDARILVVDDVEVNIEIVEFMLEEYGVHVERASDGLEAVAAAKSQHFDLILMDQMMPNMDGIEATTHIRKLEGSAGRVPIVALTANAIQGMEGKFKEAGFDGFISKPIDSKHLARTLHNILPDELIVE